MCGRRVLIKTSPKIQQKTFEIDDRAHEVSAIISIHFEPREFVSYKNEIP